MKKIFTLCAVSLMSLTAFAQSITFTSTVSAGEMDGKEFSSEGLVLSCTDTDGKMSIDANNAWFGTSTDDKISLSFRLKTAGKSSSKNNMTLVVPSDGTLLIYARTGSNSATDRNIVVTSSSDNEVINHILLETEMITEEYVDEGGETKTRKIYAPLSATVTAGTYNITYPVGSVNLYGIELKSGSTNIEGIDVKFSATRKAYKNGQLILVKDGVSYNLLGQPIK